MAGMHVCGGVPSKRNSYINVRRLRLYCTRLSTPGSYAHFYFLFFWRKRETERGILIVETPLIENRCHYLIAMKRNLLT